MVSVKRGRLTAVLNREAGTLVSLGPERVEAGLSEIFTAKGCDVEILSVATFPPLNLSLNLNGSTESHRTRMALIANNDYEDMFGIIPARSSLDAGYFTVYISKHRTRLGMLRSVLAWVLGRWKQDREIVSLRATGMEIDVKRKRRLAVMMDGEVDKVELPFKVALKPKALRVICPRIGEETRATP